DATDRVLTGMRGRPIGRVASNGEVVDLRGKVVGRLEAEPLSSHGAAAKRSNEGALKKVANVAVQ
ncbi:unnamed protein product, partial [Ostreobium quekettii]